MAASGRLMSMGAPSRRQRASTTRPVGRSWLRVARRTAMADTVGERTQRIREQQADPTGEITAVMVSLSEEAREFWAASVALLEAVEAASEDGTILHASACKHCGQCRICNAHV